jgi:hypothetical protein
MASTRNNNTPGNYEQQQIGIAKQYDNRMYTHSSNGQPASIHFAGDGLIHGRMPARDLASNGCDIESFLFGIGSTNLVNPLSPVVPDIHSLKSLHVIDRIPMALPKDLQVEAKQRPYFLN